MKARTDLSGWQGRIGRTDSEILPAWRPAVWLPPEVRTAFEDEGIAELRITYRDGAFIDWRRAPS